MLFRSLPGTQLKLSEVGFGCWTVGTNWWGKIEERDRVALLETAFESGINFFDTADTYGEGYGEEILQTALGHKRHEIIISTKFGYDFYNNAERVGHQERVQRFDTDYVRFACEQSLRRLKTDYIDLYQLHNPRINTMLENDDVFDTLTKLVQEGKIRHCGSAIGPDIGWFDEGEASMKVRKLPSTQIIYSLLEQDPARRFFPIADAEKVGLITRVPHASEILTDRYVVTPNFDPNDHRAHRKKEWLEQALKKRSQFLFLANDTGRTLAQSAIKFCLYQKTIVSVLPNITNFEELAEYVAAPAADNLTFEDIKRIDALWETNFQPEEKTLPATGGK